MEQLDSNNLSEKAIYDIKLVERAIANGDQKAYAELMTRYRDSVYFMLLKMVNNKEDADDLTIEAFGKAFKRLQQYTPNFAFSTWLFKIASNNCIDFIRKKKLNNSYSIDKTFTNEDGSQSSVDLRSDSLDPEENVIKKQKVELMRDVVEKLKPRYRQLVELRYFEELSYEEISDKLELPVGTVKAQLFRAREFLANILKTSEGKF
ncbi:MAG: sigma-70 family RNA polymerase sigma factor [Bacteroidetes bacterium]|nr:sigma-70 family RNA polymerase sigma factor [Bacteroidota bacterium]